MMDAQSKYEFDKFGISIREAIKNIEESNFVSHSNEFKSVSLPLNETIEWKALKVFLGGYTLT